MGDIGGVLLIEEEDLVRLRAPPPPGGVDMLELELSGGVWAPVYIY